MHLLEDSQVAGLEGDGLGPVWGFQVFGGGFGWWGGERGHQIRCPQLPSSLLQGG